MEQVGINRVEDLVALGLERPYGIALDVVAGKMYWTDWRTDKVQRADLDGSNVEDLVLVETEIGAGSPGGITLDTTAGKMYFTFFIISRDSKIMRADLDGSNLEEVVTTGVVDPRALALDLTAGKIYWADGYSILRADLDGANVEVLRTESPDDGPVQGIALDLVHARLYWGVVTNETSVRRANLDGSYVENVVPRLFNPRRFNPPNGIALDLICRSEGADCNENGIPDPCDPDCNDNGVPDDCDLTDGTSRDCGGNGVPDECEPDCQGNCIADDCDIASRASTDEDGNGVPDECESPGDLSFNPRVPLETTSVTAKVSREFMDSSYELCGATGTWINASHYHIDWYVRDIHNGMCSQVLITLSSEFALGVLEAGEYTVSATEYMATRTGACSAGQVFDQAEAALRVAPDCNANAVADSCDLIEGQSVDINGNGIPDECDPDCDGNGILDEMECVLVDAPQASPEGAGNNRYLSFLPDPGVSGCKTALRVTFESLPAPLDVYNGMSLWVGKSLELTENSGKRLPSEAPGWPTFWGASLRCQPYFADWSAMGTLQIYDEGLVPGPVYSVQAIGQGCATGVAENYSTSLGLTMARWGDICAPGPGGACSGPPDGIVDVANDVLGVLEKFANGGGAPSKPRADLEPAMPDQKINITDVMHALRAFGGQEYDFSVAEPCP